MVERAFELLRLVVALRGYTVLLVEQHVADGVDIAHRACFVEHSRIAKTGTGAALLQNSDVQRAYTGLRLGVTFSILETDAAASSI